jgi:nucleotide-binding universal stress UspA family protein
MTTAPQVVRIALKNILFPTDFSPASDAALPFALALAKIYGSTILMAHAVPAEPMLQVVPDRIPAQDDQDWQQAREKLAECTRNVALGDIPCKAVLNRGDLSNVIPAMVEKCRADLVVLGTHGRRGVSKMMLGSGAEQIYRSAPCPVLTVGPKAKAGADWKPRRILCPVELTAHDGDRDPESALLYGLSLAEENEAQFLVLQAVPLVPWQHREAVAQQTREGLERLLPPQARDWCTPEFIVRWEHPAEAILRTAADREADLIVMGVHRSRAAARSLAAHLPWPVASEVVSRAACPVLTVRV